MKYVLSAIGTLFGLFIAFMLLAIGVVSAANKPKGDHEQVLPGKGENPKKAIIIYQPAIGKITTKMAQQLAAGLNEGGYEVTLNHPGKHLSRDLSGYELVIFGSPTYAGQLTKAITNYMVQVCPQLAAATSEKTRIAVFATGGLDQTEEFDRLAETLSGLNVVKKVKFATGPEEDKKKKAYDLGIELAKE
jgi:flavorubredoxin